MMKMWRNVHDQIKDSERTEETKDDGHSNVVSHGRSQHLYHMFT